jgi:hypothetical protein
MTNAGIARSHHGKYRKFSRSLWHGSESSDRITKSEINHQKPGTIRHQDARGKHHRD